MTVVNLAASGRLGRWYEGTTSFSTSSSFVQVGYLNSTDRQGNIFARFTEVPIPNNASITSSSFRVTALELGPIQISQETVNTQISAVASDNADAPSNYSEAENAPRTAINTKWDITEKWSSGIVYPSPDISLVVQEVVHRSGWDTGNALVLYWEDAGTISVNNSVRLLQNSPTPAVFLYLEYTTNTAPEITVPPTVSYGSFTRTGPNNSPVTVSFTATDADGDSLTYTIRTAGSGGGTLVADGNANEGTPTNVNIAHNAPGLVEGTNSLHVRVHDGTEWSSDASFTLLVDRTAPSVGQVVVDPPIVRP